MPLSRRVFLASSTACVASGIFSSTAEAATAIRSRLFVSEWPLVKIARELVLGIGYMLLTSKTAKELSDSFGTGKLVTSLETFQGTIHQVEIDGLKVAISPTPKDQKRKPIDYYLGGLRVLAEKHPNEQLQLPEVEEVIDKEFVQHVRELAETATLEYSYRVRYKRAHVATSTVVRKGHLRKVVDLLCPVGQVMGLQFITDAQTRCGLTYITTSLWIDYCVGRREGRIVSRIAEREIGCREDALLAKLEHVVYEVVHQQRKPEELRKIVPDLIRRIETQEIG